MGVVRQTLLGQGTGEPWGVLSAGRQILAILPSWGLLGGQEASGGKL